ncbi:hypothetical protein CVT24_013343 [Panaeolus cyanescens]|uniref:Uncharacterized protein n=1 Tax=Panaeolus cyanescens TaxID=181874 RepID=A0A409X4D4_9AGAR|nr:hypothetical protein CVT24_013343 [Panaeolus cyanescens]
MGIQLNFPQNPTPPTPPLTPIQIAAEKEATRIMQKFEQFLDDYVKEHQELQSIVGKGAIISAVFNHMQQGQVAPAPSRANFEMVIDAPRLTDSRTNEKTKFSGFVQQLVNDADKDKDPSHKAAWTFLSQDTKLLMSGQSHANDGGQQGYGTKRRNSNSGLQRQNSISGGSTEGRPAHEHQAASLPGQGGTGVKKASMRRRSYPIPRRRR